MRPTVAVCIGTYNQAQFLEEAVESAIRQTFPIETIWVSDDKSTDSTPDVLARLKARWPSLQIMSQPTNLGPAANLTWAMSQPKTDYVLRLDSDDVLEPGYAETLVALMEDHPTAGYAHSNTRQIDAASRITMTRRLNRNATLVSAEESIRAMATSFKVSANMILYRREALEKADFFRPNIGWLACEDSDLCIRIALAGYANVFSPLVLSRYRVWDDEKGVRFGRKLNEVQSLNRLYRQRILPEFAKRGWDQEPLLRNLASKAVGYAGVIDKFQGEDNRIYQNALRELGDTRKLQSTILLANLGLNPAIRRLKLIKVRAKNMVKALLAHVRKQDQSIRV